MEPILIAIFAVFIFLLILSLLVFVHEAGHFFAAKRSGIKVEEFGFGLPPRAWGVKRGDTIYSINWLPFGGFVKLYGEDEAGAGKVTLQTQASDIGHIAQEVIDTNIFGQRAFSTQPLSNRIVVVVAGVVMNLVLAVVLYYIILASQGFTTKIPLLYDHKFVGVNQTEQKALLFAETVPGAPIDKAGLTTDDRIVTYDGKPVSSAKDFADYVTSKKGREVTLQVMDIRDVQREVVVVPRVEVPAGEGPLGIKSLGEFRTATLRYETPVQKIFSGFTQTYNVGVYSFEVFGKIIGQSINERDAGVAAQGVSGPIGIFDIVKQIIGIGGTKAVSGLLEFMALLSLNLAVVNVLPFPALDGGRLLFLVIEGITRRKVHPSFERYANTIGMAVLLSLIVLITFNDLKKIFFQ